MKKLKLTIIISSLLFAVSSCGSTSDQIEGGTNVQEPNVDEGDIVKVSNDGLIFKMQNDGVSITSTDDGSLHMIASTINVSSIPLEMYYYNNNLITLTGNYTSSQNISYDVGKYYKNSYETLNIDFYDLTNLDRKSQEVEELSNYKSMSFKIDGMLGDSRLYQSSNQMFTMIKISKYEANLSSYYENSELVREIHPEFNYQFNDKINVFNDCSKINNLYYDAYAYEDITFFVNFDVSNNSIVASKCFYGAEFQDCYISDNSIYPIFYQIGSVSGSNRGCYSYNLECRYSHILKLNPKFELESEVRLDEYTIYNRYALKEYDELLFVCGASPYHASIFAYDVNMNLISSIDDIVYGEEIKSVTYNEDDTGRYCYVTTYRNTDPLFKINITDCRNMKVEGALEVQGYATYMHNISDDKMITIGYDGDDKQADESNLKVSLIDCSSSTPLLINSISINNVNYAEVLENEKAVIFSDKLFGFSISQYKVGSINKFLIFSVVNAELVCCGIISSPLDDIHRFDREPLQYFRYYYSRMIVINDYCYITSNSYISSYSVIKLLSGTIEEISHIDTSLLGGGLNEEI